MGIAVFGLVELMNLINISVDLTKSNHKTNAKFMKQAEDIMSNATPVLTGDTLASEGSEQLVDGFQVFADIDYSIWNDQGTSKFKGYKYSNKVVTGLERAYLEESQTNLSSSIEGILGRTTRSGLGFINPFTGFQGGSTYKFLFGGI